MHIRCLKDVLILETEGCLRKCRNRIRFYSLTRGQGCGVMARMTFGIKGSQVSSLFVNVYLRISLQTRVPRQLGLQRGSVSGKGRNRGQRSCCSAGGACSEAVCWVQHPGHSPLLPPTPLPPLPDSSAQMKAPLSPGPQALLSPPLLSAGPSGEILYPFSIPSYQARH